MRARPAASPPSVSGYCQAMTYRAGVTISGTQGSGHRRAQPTIAASAGVATVASVVSASAPSEKPRTMPTPAAVARTGMRRPTARERVSVYGFQGARTSSPCTRQSIAYDGARGRSTRSR